MDETPLTPLGYANLEKKDIAVPTTSLRIIGLLGFLCYAFLAAPCILMFLMSARVLMRRSAGPYTMIGVSIAGLAAAFLTWRAVAAFRQLIGR